MYILFVPSLEHRATEDGSLPVPAMSPHVEASSSMAISNDSSDTNDTNGASTIDPSQRWEAMEKLLTRPSPFGAETGLIATGEFDPFENVSPGNRSFALSAIHRQLHRMVPHETKCPRVLGVSSPFDPLVGTHRKVASPTRCGLDTPVEQHKRGDLHESSSSWNKQRCSTTMML